MKNNKVTVLNSYTEKKDWVQDHRELLAQRALTYLSGFSHLGIGPDKTECYEFADMCINEQCTAREAVSRIIKSRMQGCNDDGC